MVTKVDIECDNCSLTFKRLKSRYDNSIKRGLNQFCSKACHSDFKSMSKIFNCKECGLDVKVARAQINKSKSNNFSATLRALQRITVELELILIHLI
jgi:hypothetical protein